jgi:hypothetical protein
METRCECGTFAIGLCASCEKPVCGDHSRLLDGARRCEPCLASAQREQAVSTAEGELEHLTSRRDLELARLEAIDDPVERLISAVLWSEEPLSHASFWLAERAVFTALPSKQALQLQQRHDQETRERLDALLRGTSLFRPPLTVESDSNLRCLRLRPVTPYGETARLGRGWPWDSARIGEWFAARADWSTTEAGVPQDHRHVMPPRPIELSARRGLFKLWSVAELPIAWRIRYVVSHSGQDYSHRVSTASVHVLHDGRVIQHSPGRRTEHKHRGMSTDWEEVELAPIDLLTLAQLLGLRPPETPLRW